MWPNRDMEGRSRPKREGHQERAATSCRCQYLYAGTSKRVSVCTVVLVKRLEVAADEVQGVSICTRVLVSASVSVLLY